WPELVWTPAVWSHRGSLRPGPHGRRCRTMSGGDPAPGPARPRRRPPPSAMTACLCGRTLLAGEQFCAWCGRPVPDAATGGAAPPAWPGPRPEAPEPTPERRTRTLEIALVLLVLFAVALGSFAAAFRIGAVDTAALGRLR